MECTRYIMTAAAHPLASEANLRPLVARTACCPREKTVSSDNEELP
jgi:hypothetical protein